MKLGGFFEKAANLLFPRRCAFCGEVLGGGVCEPCMGELVWAGADLFPACATGRKFDFDGCTAPFEYAGAAKKGLLRMKLGGKRDGAGVFAEHMLRCVEREYAGIVFDAAVAAPPTRSSLKRRGFDQAAILARRVAKGLGITYIGHALEKRRSASEQKALGFLQRQANLSGAVSLRARIDVSGKTLLLVDDVLTTGATLSECARVLKAAGASSVYCVVFAATRLRR